MCSFSKAILDLSYPFDQSCRTISQSSPHWAANIFIRALRKGSSLSMFFTQRLRPCEYFLCKLNFFQYITGSDVCQGPLSLEWGTGLGQPTRVVNDSPRVLLSWLCRSVVWGSC